MTEQIESAIEVQNPTDWRKLLAWLTRFDEAMNYDPVVHSAELVRDLGVQLSHLEFRVIELERSTEHDT